MITIPTTYLDKRLTMSKSFIYSGLVYIYILCMLYIHTMYDIYYIFIYIYIKSLNSPGNSIR